MILYKTKKLMNKILIHCDKLKKAPKETASINSKMPHQKKNGVSI